MFDMFEVKNKNKKMSHIHADTVTTILRHLRSFHLINNLIF